MPEPDRAPPSKRTISRAGALIITRLAADRANNKVRKVTVEGIRGDNKRGPRLDSGVV